MAKFRKEGKVFEVGSPDLNPGLVSGATPVSDSTPLGSVSSQNLVQSNTIDFQEVQESPVFPVGDLELTQPEVKAQGFNEQLQDLNTRLLGESAFRAGREEEAELPALLTTQQDLSSRLKAIQSEAKAIPLQLQQEAKGRGITVGGLRPLQTARLRTNAIQALGVSSLLEASRGNITLAQDLVDRAVAQQFDPIREEIAVKRANLNLILESPSFTLAEKNRARRTMAQESAREKEINEQEANQRAVANIAIDVASRGGDAVLLRQIQQNQDPVEAQRMASEAGFGAITADEQFTLGKGQVRFDSEGNVIARGPADVSGVKPTTPAQFLVSGFAQRIIQSSNIIDNLESQISGMSAIEFGIQKRLPNALKSDTARQLEQAQRNFINAVLRRESGAAISPEEFVSGSLQYFFQPGDDKTTSLQKRMNRELVEDNFIAESGPAFAPSPLTDLPTGDEETSARNAKIGDTVLINGVPHTKVGEDDFELTN
ncbi:MAG TPA: hypothetical protein ENI23_11230 [bacterium]|nr:hypothetical protein [bacterium]